MDQLKYFKNTHYNGGNIHVGAKNVPVYWDIVDGRTGDIEAVVPGCGCTDASVNGSQVVAKYNDNSDISAIQATSAQALLVTKTVRAYIKDGLPLRVENDRGVQVYNPDKKQISLTFTVTVVP